MWSGLISKSTKPATAGLQGASPPGPSASSLKLGLEEGLALTGLERVHLTPQVLQAGLQLIRLGARLIQALLQDGLLLRLLLLPGAPTGALALQGLLDLPGEGQGHWAGLQEGRKVQGPEKGKGEKVLRAHPPL